MDPKTGVILVSARRVTGALRWGPTATTATNPLTPARCVAAGAATRCQLGTGAQAVTPPASCTLYLTDASAGPCVARVRGCTPGLRSGHQWVVKDANGVVVGRTDPADLGVIVLETPAPDGRPLLASVGRSGFAPGRSYLLFESPACSGPGLFGPPNAEFFVLPSIYQTPGMLFFAPDNAQARTIRSSHIRPFPQAECSVAVCPGWSEATFMAPDTCCCSGGTQIGFAGPALAVDVSRFVPPFHVETE